MRKASIFPVIVMVATNGPEGSSRVRDKPFREMMERLFANKAIVHTRLFTHSSVSSVKQGGGQMRWGIDIGEATGGSYNRAEHRQRISCPAAAVGPRISPGSTGW